MLKTKPNGQALDNTLHSNRMEYAMHAKTAEPNNETREYIDIGDQLYHNSYTIRLHWCACCVYVIFMFNTCIFFISRFGHKKEHGSPERTF